MILLARIDDRLIHGQVTVGWSRFLNIEKIIVISDELSIDDNQRQFLALAVPESTDFELYSVEEAAGKLSDPSSVEKKTMLLAASPQEFKRLILDYGIKLMEINLGGQRYKEGRHFVCEGVRLTDEALSDLKALHNAGIAVEVRLIPSNQKQNLFDIYKEENE